MRKLTHVVLAAAAAAGLTLAGALPASAAPAIPLSNGQETPGATGGAHGFFSYAIDGDELCYTLEVQRLSAPAVAAHIHIGQRNVAGPVVVPLVVPAATDFEVSACTTADESVLAAISAEPGAYYVNVHTPNHPPGEIRGQLK